jgi:hypothetical protein
MGNIEKEGMKLYKQVDALVRKNTGSEVLSQRGSDLKKQLEDPVHVQMEAYLNRGRTSRNIQNIFSTACPSL